MNRAFGNSLIASLLIMAGMSVTMLIPQAQACTDNDGDNNGYDPVSPEARYDLVENSHFNLSCVITAVPIPGWTEVAPGWFSDNSQVMKPSGAIAMGANKEGSLAQRFHVDVASAYRGVRTVEVTWTPTSLALSAMTAEFAIEFNDVLPTDELAPQRVTLVASKIITPGPANQAQPLVLTATDFRLATSGLVDPGAAAVILTGIPDQVTVTLSGATTAVNGKLSAFHVFPNSPVIRPAIGQEDTTGDGSIDTFWLFNDFNQNGQQEAGEPDLTPMRFQTPIITIDYYSQEVAAISFAGGTHRPTLECVSVTATERNTGQGTAFANCEVVRYPHVTTSLVLCAPDHTPLNTPCGATLEGEVCVPAPGGTTECVPFLLDRELPTMPAVCVRRTAPEDMYDENFPYSPLQVSVGIALDGDAESGWQTGRNGSCDDDPAINIVDVDTSLLGPLIPVRPASESRLSLDASSGFVGYRHLVGGQAFSVPVTLVCPDGTAATITLAGSGGLPTTAPWPSELDGCLADGTWSIVTAEDALAGFFLFSFDGQAYREVNTWQVGTKNNVQEAFVAYDPVLEIHTTTWYTASTAQKYYAPV